MFLILVATYVGFGLKYGIQIRCRYSIVGNDTKELLEGEWVKSDYGVPPIMISTPVVLERIELKAIDSTSKILNEQHFHIRSADSQFDIGVSTTKYKLQEGQEIDVQGAVEETIKLLENNGARNLIVKQEQYITPNAAEGLKIYGTWRISNRCKRPIQNQENISFSFL